jgi:hypothetical protein
MAGAEPYELQIDITADKPIDDNQFEVELANIVDNSFNIHHIGNRLSSNEEENARSKLLAHAKNDKLFQNGETSSISPRKSGAVIGGSEDVSQSYRVVVLRKEMAGDPWSEFDEKEQPKSWDGRLPLVVARLSREDRNVLGKWLKTHARESEHDPIFAAAEGHGNIYYDRELLILTRAVYLAMKWKATEKVYADLERSFRKDELIPKLKSRFDRFAVLNEWNFAEPGKCRVEEAKHDAQGDKIPDAVDRICTRRMYSFPKSLRSMSSSWPRIPNPSASSSRNFVSLDSGGKPCIPWLGEIVVKERVIRMCAEGQIAINVRGLDLLQAKPGEDADDAWIA